MRRVGVRALGFLVVCAAALCFGGEPAGADWHHPVDAPVTDPFRQPQTAFGAGNRGLEYGTAGGEVVRAVDGGTVVFAGSVGGRHHVVVDHGEGLRSTYAFVSGIDVIRGQRVRQGQRVATAGAGVHLTARLGSTYVDPMLLIDGAEVVVRLRSGIDPPQVSGEDRQLSPYLAVLDAADDLTLSQQLLAVSRSAQHWHYQECTEDGADLGSSPADSASAPDAGPRVLIQVGGLGTSSDSASIGGLDYATLGYDSDNVVGFSYAGGCTPEAFGGGTSSLHDALSTQPYRPEDTLQPVDVSAAHLADLIESVSAQRPGQPIDIAAHSLGGVVTRRALEMLADRGGLDSVDVVVTIGSPHGGPDLATGAVAVAGSPAADTIIEAIGGDAAEFHDADSVFDIAEAGGGGVVDPAPPPDGVTVVAIAGSTDLIVPGGQATWDGATNVVVPTAILDAPSVHGALPSLPEVHREFELALAGAPPRCVGLGEVIGSAVVAQGVSALEDTVTVLAGLTRWVL